MIVSEGAMMIKADSNQKDPKFTKSLNNGQRHYKQFIRNAKILTDLPDVKIIELYIKMFETVIGVFRYRWSHPTSADDQP
jgi:hypothetical protein